MDKSSKNCIILHGKYESEILFTGLDLLQLTSKYKKQKIINSKGETFGYEILLKQEKNQRRYSSTTLIDRIYKALIKFDDFDNYFGKNIFVNFEVYELCNYQILKKIVELKIISEACGKNLICEITERNLCFPCTNFSEGIKYLFDKGVTLAADDYVLFRNDFRKNLIEQYFDIVKIEVPKLSCEYIFDFINEVTKISKKTNRIVFERIETEEQLNFIKSISRNKDLFQGYTIHLPTEIEI